jgi:SOS response regulatory protein OraA/RecX
VAIVVKSIRTRKTQGGKSLLISLSIETADGYKEYTISEGAYREIGCPLSDDIIDEEALSRIAFADELMRARRKALVVLSYGDNSEKNLRLKLLRSGARAAIADEVAREMVSLGYVNDKRQIEDLALKYSTSLFGRRKIVAKLLEKGYAREDVNAALTALSKDGRIDFKKNAALLIEKKLTPPYTREDVKKLLYKNGY